MKQYRLSDTQKIELVKKFETGTYTFMDLSKEFNISLPAIKGLLNRRGYKAKSQSELQRKYPIDETFFDKIDTQEKAYFLGILYADGVNSPERNSVAITLQEKDKAILEKLNNLLQPTKPLQYVKLKKGNNQYRITMVSKHISQKLSDLGCTRVKSFTLTFPEWMPKDLIPHFVRGYWDGDGWIGKRAMTIVSTEMFCNSLSDILNADLDINTYIRARHPERKTTTRMMEVSGRNKCIKLIDWMYSNSTIHLERKFNAAINIKSFALKNILSGEHRLKNQDELPTSLVGVMTLEAQPIAFGVGG